MYDGYRLIGDALSVVVLAGIGYFVLRRFALPNRRALQFADNILLHPRAASGAIASDSLIVAAFILLHVGARFLGEVPAGGAAWRGRAHALCHSRGWLVGAG